MTKGPGLGIDPSKPMMISETGSVLYPDDAQKTAGWYAGIPATLSKYPQIKGVTLGTARRATPATIASSVTRPCS